MLLFLFWYAFSAVENQARYFDNRKCVRNYPALPYQILNPSANFPFRLHLHYFFFQSTGCFHFNKRQKADLFLNPVCSFLTKLILLVFCYYYKNFDSIFIKVITTPTVMALALIFCHRSHASLLFHRVAAYLRLYNASSALRTGS